MVTDAVVSRTALAFTTNSWIYGGVDLAQFGGWFELHFFMVGGTTGEHTTFLIVFSNTGRILKSMFEYVIGCTASGASELIFKIRSAVQMPWVDRRNLVLV